MSGAEDDGAASSGDLEELAPRKGSTSIGWRLSGSDQ